MGRNEGVELSIPQGFEGSDVIIPQARRDLDGVALQSAQELAVEGNGGIPQLSDERPARFVVRDNDGDLPVFDETEIFGDGFKLEEKGEGLVSAVQVKALSIKDAFRIPAFALLIVVEIEIVADRFLAEEVRVEVDELVGDLGRFPEVGFRLLIFGPEYVGGSRSRELAIAITTPGSLSDGVEAGEGAINDGKINIDTGFYQLGGDNAGG